MASTANKLQELVRIVPSGYRHPYFVVTRDKEPDDMLAHITSYPAIGAWTVIPDSQQAINFSVLVESNHSDIQAWAIEIWWGHGGADDWSSLPLTPDTALQARVLTSARHTHHYWYNASLLKPSQSFQFTIRFKTAPSAEWKWVAQTSGLEDGRIILQPSAPYQDTLDTYIEGIEYSGLAAQKLASDTPDTALWSLTGRTIHANDRASGWSRYNLGRVKHGQRWFALVRLMTPWLAPRHGRFMHHLAKEDAISYSFLRNDGLHVVCLAVSGVNDVQTVLCGQDGQLIINARNDAEVDQELHVMVAVGRSLDFAMSAAVYKARSIVSPYSNNTNPPTSPDGQVKTNWVQDWFDGFAYCTWNGLGKQLTEAKLEHALSALKERGVNVTNLIIDDNWQTLDNEGESNMKQGWKDFEANPRGFPNGLKSAIGNIRKKHGDLQHIAVWHALLGYWGGISPEGKLAKLYGTRRVDVRRDAILADASMLVIDPLHAPKMYNDFYAFLSSCGIDAVKTDAQFALDELTSARDRREMFSTYKTAWTTAHLTHLAGHAISCMSQTPFMLFASQLPNNTPAILVRNSDDFFPNVEDSHPWHVYCNAYNALFTKHLNALPDWDMFQTSHSWASFHAASRCLSGGPIYVTDKPGEYNVDLIKQMTGQTSRDQTVILRPSVVGRSGDAYVGYEEDALLKIDAYDGAAKTGAAFCGIFNCRSWPLARIVHLGELLSLDNGIKYVVRAFQTGNMTPALALDDHDSVFGVQLDGRSWEILTATPVTELSLGLPEQVSFRAQVSTLGLISHMTGAAALVSHTAIVSPNMEAAKPGQARHRIKIEATLKVLGTLGIWVACQAQTGTAPLSKKNMLVLIEGLAISSHLVDVAQASQVGQADAPVLISVDIAAAWAEMKLAGTSTNDIKVEVLVGL